MIIRYRNRLLKILSLHAQNRAKQNSFFDSYLFSFREVFRKKSDLDNLLFMIFILSGLTRLDNFTTTILRGSREI